MQNVQCKTENAEDIDRSEHVSSATPVAKQNDLGERFLNFADRVISVVEALPDSRVGRRISDQILRSGTSSLANYEEACAAESRRDFVHKLRICLKEVRESRAWLRLTARRGLLPAGRLEDLIDEADQLARIIGRSIATANGVRKENQTPK